MKGIYLLDDTIISPLGFSTEDNLQAIRNKISGLRWHENPGFSSGGFYAGILDPLVVKEEFGKLKKPGNFTKLEQMMLLSVNSILQRNPDIDLSTTRLIISTTKGNIDHLQDSNFPQDRVLLSGLGEVIRNFFGFSEKPIIVSNACISGGLALAIAKRLITARKFENTIIVGGDLVSDFVVSGFQSFQAVSDRPCRPFSKSRNGISLGEASAALLVSGNMPSETKKIKIIGEASINDANHISGPSRTGEGLFRSISAALADAQVSADEIDYLSAHGTATLFNDEMEALAFNRAGMGEVPVNSYKGYFGHTLGASALLESILTKHSLLNNELFTSLNFDHLGTTKGIRVIKQKQNLEMEFAMKTASGFGGCNLAMVFKKEGDA